jgi:hypothetical protein
VVGRPIVENCLNGFNSSVLAYGQTGSGKTFTMLGQVPAKGQDLPEQVLQFAILFSVDLQLHDLVRSTI